MELETSLDVNDVVNEVNEELNKHLLKGWVCHISRDSSSNYIELLITNSEYYISNHILPNYFETVYKGLVRDCIKEIQLKEWAAKMRGLSAVTTTTKDYNIV